MFKRIIPILVVLALSNTISAQTYVSVATGIDTAGCGTFNNPCGTIQYAIDSVNADSLILFAGTYRGQIIIPDDTNSISFTSLSFLNQQVNDVTLTTTLSPTQSDGSLFYHENYAGTCNSSVINSLSIYGIDIDSVQHKSPWINDQKDDGNIIIGCFRAIHLEKVSISNTSLYGNWCSFISTAHYSTKIKASSIIVPPSNWDVGTTDILIEGTNILGLFELQDYNQSNDTANIVDSELSSVNTWMSSVFENSIVGTLRPNCTTLDGIIIDHCDINSLNPINSFGSPQYNIKNSIFRSVPPITNYFSVFSNNIVPTGTNLTPAISSSGNIVTSATSSLPSNNSNNPIFPGLGAGISTGLNTDKEGNPRPMPSGTNPDIGPYESVLSSPLICNLQASVAYEDSICSNSNTWAVLQSTSSIDSMYWSNASVNIDSALFPVGYHSVYLKDSLGCDTTIYFNVYSQQTIPPYDSYRPCYIYCDLDTGLNRVVMNTPSDLSGLHEWELLENVFGVWSVVSTKAVGDTTPWYHLNSNPYSKSYQYKIRLTDSCGLSYTQSDTVRTVLLQSSLGTNGEVNLSWNKYAGADIWYYVIYRKQGLAYYAIDSVGANNTSYIDNNAPAGNLTYYLGAVLQNPCSSSINKNGTLDNTRFFSNTVTQAVVGIEEQSRQLKISPNPTTGILDIDVPYSVDFEVINMNGQIVQVGKTEGIIDIGNLPSGSYQLVIKLKSGLQTHTIYRL